MDLRALLSKPCADALPASDSSPRDLAIAFLNLGSAPAAFVADLTHDEPDPAGGAAKRTHLTCVRHTATLKPLRTLGTALGVTVDGGAKLWSVTDMMDIARALFLHDSTVVEPILVGPDHLAPAEQYLALALAEASSGSRNPLFAVGLLARALGALHLPTELVPPLVGGVASMVAALAKAAGTASVGVPRQTDVVVQASGEGIKLSPVVASWLHPWSMTSGEKCRLATFLWRFLAAPSNLTSLRVPEGAVLDFDSAFALGNNDHVHSPKQLYELLVLLYEVAHLPHTKEAEDALLSLLPPLVDPHMQDVHAVCKRLFADLLKRRVPAAKRCALAHLHLLRSFFRTLVCTSACSLS